MKILRTLTTITTATLVLLWGNEKEARGEFIVDQSQTSFDEFFNLQFSGVTGQEFTPALPSLDVVELLFDGPGGTFPPNIPGQFSVGIHTGSVAGPVVGTSLSVTLLTGIFREVVPFQFPTSVPLVPGDLYSIEINRLSDPDLPFFVGATDMATYPGGSAVINGLSRPDLDLFFREGPRSAIVVPAPRTLALLGSGLVALFVLWKRQEAPRRKPLSSCSLWSCAAPWQSN